MSIACVCPCRHVIRSPPAVAGPRWLSSGARAARDRDHVQSRNRSAPTASVTPTPVVESYAVPGKKPDHAGAWVDEKDHSAISNAHAIAEAAILAVAKKKTNDRDGRFMFLNSLDRVDDPATRHKMMDHYKSITGEKLDTTIGSAVEVSISSPTLTVPSGFRTVAPFSTMTRWIFGPIAAVRI
jgi:hypothetical protein